MWRNFLISFKCYLLFIGVNGNICENYYGEFSLKDGYNKFLEPANNITIQDQQTLHNIVEVNNYISSYYTQCVLNLTFAMLEGFNNSNFYIIPK